nr:cysteine--tRNA ligase [Candidatus Paceibacterota bacterium]
SVEAAMDNDFNTAEAFAAIFTIIRDANSRNVVPAPPFFEFLSSVFGIVPNTHTTIPTDIQSKIDARQQARDAKDFSTSDRIRSELLELGYSVDDTPYGPLVKNI